MNHFTIKHLWALWILLLTALPLSAAEVVTYYHNDQLGSPIAATDDTGAVVWEQAYDPWGDTLIATPDNRAFTGNWKDPETGLSDHKARWHSAQIGRFTSIDPVGWVPTQVHSFNRYAYGNNNPYSYTDRDGEFAVPLIPILAVIAFEALGIASEVATMEETQDSINRSGAGTFGLGGLKTGKAALSAARSEAGNSVTKEASREITKSSRKRVKRLVRDLSDNSRQNNGLFQEKTDQLRRIVEKAGGKLRNDGASGVKGSSAGKPHVQAEGLGKSIDSRHIWTRDGVQ